MGPFLDDIYKKAPANKRYTPHDQDSRESIDTSKHNYYTLIYKQQFQRDKGKQRYRNVR